jgi:hypothetical protein
LPIFIAGTSLAGSGFKGFGEKIAYRTHGILSLVRLPIPPLSQVGDIVYFVLQPRERRIGISA